MKSSLDSERIIKEIEDAFFSIGYKHDLIRKDYPFTDFISPKPALRSITLAVFGQEPMDYRSACFGVEFVHDSLPSKDLAVQYRAFGAPQLFLVRNGKAEWWVNKEKGTFLQDEITTSNVPSLITSNAASWNPEKMIRLKSGFQEPMPQQLDFIDIGLLPALENQASTKIDSLISRILYNAEKEFERRRLSFDAAVLFNIVFRLLTAKLLTDRDILTTPEIDFGRPWTALKAVGEYYGEAKPMAYEPEALPEGLLGAIAGEIHKSFSLRNLSVDTLAYVYENTFVSQKSRKKFGIHSTPSYIADYVLTLMPIGDLPRSAWHVLDPMCGHGIFLIAAMRRMRNLIPSDWTGRQRHSFFSERLHGIEIDPFSAEVARLCLTLADFPESDGWDLRVEDVFGAQSLDPIMNKANIFVGNPPFEALEGVKPETPKPKELLRKILPKLPEGALFGFVLPHSFLDGSDYRAERQIFHDSFEVISVTTLPDRIFKYSDAETAVFIAKKHTASRMPKTIFRHVREADRSQFRLYSTPTFEDVVSSSYFVERMQGRFLLPPLREVWEVLDKNPRLIDIAEIKTGVEYEPGLLEKDPEQIVQDRPFPDAVPGIFKVTQGFKQYATSDVVYMTMEEEHRRKAVPGAWHHDWKKPKVVIPKSVMSRGPWRFAAVVDRKSLLIRRRFFAVWPKTEKMTVEFLAGVLNSPIAQAFAYAHSDKRDIPKRVYASIPVPFDCNSWIPLISELVDAYLHSIKRSAEKAKEILFKIDGAILRLYDLPVRLERQLLDLFFGHRRPVPFDFTGYESRDLSSSIAERNLPEARLMPEVSEFCFQKGISEYLETTLKVIKESFPPVRGLHLLKEQDPEAEEQWLLIDITVDGSIDDILEGYDHYVDQWVKSVPESVRKNIRLSYSVY